MRCEEKVLAYAECLVPVRCCGLEQACVALVALFGRAARPGQHPVTSSSMGTLKQQVPTCRRGFSVIIICSPRKCVLLPELSLHHCFFPVVSVSQSRSRGLNVSLVRCLAGHPTKSDSHSVERLALLFFFPFFFLQTFYL